MEGVVVRFFDENTEPLLAGPLEDLHVRGNITG
jgi:hypothetical protein